MKHFDVVIIGGGPAGRVVVHELHRAQSAKTVALIKDEAINVNRCAVPFGIDGKKPLEKYLIPNSLVSDFGAELIVDRALSVDTKRQTVAMGRGEEVGYGELVFATGARPFIPELSGVEAENVFAVRAESDLEQLREAARRSERAVVIGAGFIGVETAVVLRKMGLEVVLVSKYPYVMQSNAEPELVKDIQEDLLTHGVKIQAESRAQAFDTKDGFATSVRLDNGSEEKGDFFVLAIGVVPNTDLAREGGLDVGPLGIVTNELLQASCPNIYASGDCAQKKSFVSGRPIKGEFGTNAVFMSKVVSGNILGNEERFPGVINASGATSFSLGFGSAGLTEKQAIEQGIEAISGTSEVLDKYPMMEQASLIKTKLVFDKNSRKLVGGSVLRRGTCAAQNVDFLSLAIQMNASIDDIVHYQYATHPELAAKPSDNMYVFAAKEALEKL